MPSLNGIERAFQIDVILHTIMLMPMISTETGFMSMPSAQWKTLRNYTHMYSSLYTVFRSSVQ